MSSPILLHPRPHNPQHQSTSPAITNPLPLLLQTPSGLALLELQGTINLPPFPPDTAPAPASADDSRLSSQPTIPIGRLHFPEYHPDHTPENDTAWMKRVWMYVGEHQRLQGEVRKLPRAVAVLRKRGVGRLGDGSGEGMEGVGGEEGEGGSREELEVVEIVKYKIVFSSRPEPVGSGGTS